MRHTTITDRPWTWVACTTAPLLIAVAAILSIAAEPAPARPPALVQDEGDASGQTGGDQ